MKKLYFCILGIVTGITNGLFGSGGGILAVPLLKKSGMSVKESHATSLAVTLPLSVVSCFFYVRSFSFSHTSLICIIAFGLAGAFLGSILMKKLSGAYLKKAFGIILIISGIRLFIK